jgi:adenine-specific DNA glycosylase
VLDGNVARVVARLLATRGDLREPGRWLKLQRTADELLERNSPGDWNQAMMELGATICTPRAPQCLLCPVAKYCAARKQGMQEEIPEKRKKRATVAVTLATAVFVDRQGRTLLLPPPRQGAEAITADHVPTLVSKMWHFPTIVVTRDSLAELERHLKSVFTLDGKRAPHSTLRLVALPRVKHSVTYRQVTIFPFRIALAKLPISDGAKIVALDDLASMPISNLTRKVARVALVAATP